MFNLFNDNEVRNSAIKTVSPSDGDAWKEFFGLDGALNGEIVTEEKALGVPAIWQAVNAIAGTISALPLHLYEKTSSGMEKATDNYLYPILHDRPNEFQTTAQFLKWFLFRLSTGGRATAMVSRNRKNEILGIYPLDGSKLKISQTVGAGKVRRSYAYTHDNGTTTVYDASKVLDVVLSPKPNGLDHYSPIQVNKDAIALMIATQAYAAKLFNNGGVPLLSLNSQVDAMSPQAAARASANIFESLQASARSRSGILVPPAGHRLDPIGLDPAKSQLLELRRFMISETSRIFNIAPAILHDLTTGTYSNVEQQSLSFASQTLTPLIEAVEQEFNAKLFPKGDFKVEFAMNGLLRGDFTTRMDGLQKAVQSAILTPNEARALENRPPLPGGDRLYIQGANIPLEDAKAPDTAPAPESDIEDDPEHQADPADDTKETEDAE